MAVLEGAGEDGPRARPHAIMLSRATCEAPAHGVLSGCRGRRGPLAVYDGLALASICAALGLLDASSEAALKNARALAAELLQRYLSHTLDAPRRFRLKLANPLGVGAALVKRYSAIAAERVMLIADDLGGAGRCRATTREAPSRPGPGLRMAAVEKELAVGEPRWTGVTAAAFPPNPLV